MLQLQQCVFDLAHTPCDLKRILSFFLVWSCVVRFEQLKANPECMIKPEKLEEQNREWSMEDIANEMCAAPTVYSY